VLIGISVLLLIPVAMAAFTPLLAPVPSQAAGWTAPPLPERDEPLPDFQHLLDPLPLVVRDLPDSASQGVIAIYDTTSFTDHQSAQRMVTAAEEAILLPANLDATWRSWLHDPQSNDVPGSVMDYLQEDSLNAGRLSNLAVAMYFEVLTRGPRAFDSEGSTRTRQALSLLDSTISRFPGSRAPLLNRAYIGALGGALSFDGTQSKDFGVGHPEDATALRLAVNLYVNSNWNYVQDRNALQTRAAAMSQSEDPTRAAFGYTMLGDLELGDLHLDDRSNFSKVELAPHATMRSARLALQHYDQALALSDDPSIYTARAFALNLLGDIPGAIATQQRAIELLPESISLRLLLADLHLQQRGTTEQIRASIETARLIEREAISAALTQEAPRLSGFRPITDVGEVNGLASNLPGMFYGYYMNLLAGGRGGGFLVSFDLIPLYEDRPAMTNSPNPIERAIGGSLLKSEALGDPDAVDDILSFQQLLLQDANWYGVITPQEDESSQTVARLVANPDDASQVDLQSTEGMAEVSKAASWLRFAGANQEAIDLCHSALKHGATNPDRFHRCVAENAYLLGDYKTSQEAFAKVHDDVMVGYVAERRGALDEAIRRYELVIENDNESTRGTAMFRLAEVLLETGDPDGAIALYDELLVGATPRPGCVDKISCPYAVVAPFAQSNRGIARLQALANENGRIDCEGEFWEACTAAFLDFNTALETDPYNPVFLMNQAWATRLLGDLTLSQQLMNQALEADRSLYPVLNDLGVSAAASGDTKAARQYFLDATAANPHYDLALWNLGVLYMREGIGGVFRGQAYLARAILQNPSLVTDSMGFRTDERVYRVEINERLRPGTGWTFGAASSMATAAFGLLTVMLVIFPATYVIVRDKLLEVAMTRIQSRAPWILQHIPRGLPTLRDDRWGRWVPIAAALAVLAFTTTWIARHGEPNTAAASAAVALFAVMLAVVTHELGHALVASRVHATVQPTQWTPGTVLALALLPIGLSSGPFPGQKVVAESEAASKWVYMAGPLANLIVAVLAYLLFSMQPLPGIRLISQVQLAAMSYALLPFAPLDGAALAHAHPRLLSALASTALLFGVLFSVGIL